MYGTFQEIVTSGEFLYSFNGTDALVYGRATAIGTSSISWTCFIDDVAVGSGVISPESDGFKSVGLEGPYPFCGSPRVPEGQHEFRMSVNATQNVSFSFDYLLYTPFESSPAPTADLFFTTDNPNFEYGTGWGAVHLQLGGAGRLFLTEGMATASVGSQFTFKFYGVSVLWIGFYNATFYDYAQDGYHALNYSIDGEAPTYITLDVMIAPELNITSNTAVAYPLFETFAYPRKQHTLEVDFLGFHGGSSTSQLMPLTLSNLVVRNGTTAPSTFTSPASSPTTKMGGAETPRTHLAIILGSCAAALAFSALIIFLVFRGMKRRKNVSGGLGTSDRIEPFSHDPAFAPVDAHQKRPRVDPFSHDPDFAPVNPHRKGQNVSLHQEVLNIEPSEIVGVPLSEIGAPPSEIDAPPSYVTQPSFTPLVMGSL
ncbi:hypothetical protein GALMADRAFT_160157 [Galerina marginata CBS 339.88]|uniref:Uncharacterized protein n=1 Tax=Galerina marginata (strain CBS 339.88) TaxID=685588 RepID=A0A067SGI9_GALM3|nr:hypothetical protein GALMADRAFT_160157 [Galerina marginata CBS 339.88]